MAKTDFPCDFSSVISMPEKRQLSCIQHRVSWHQTVQPCTDKDLYIKAPAFAHCAQNVQDKLFSVGSSGYLCASARNTSKCRSVCMDVKHLNNSCLT